MKKIVGLVLMLGIMSSSVWADTLSDIKKNVEKIFGLEVAEVNKTPYDNLYEILSTNLDTTLYTDDNVSFLLDGHLIDAKTREVLSEKGIQKMAKLKFEKLPFEYALKRVNGTGKYKIVSFEDPNCGYCKILYKELDKISDATVYTFMVAILGGDSDKIVNDVWCSADRNKAWAQWMLEGVRPKTAEGSCRYDHAPDVLSAGRGYKLRGTPLIIMGNGEMLKGFAKAEVIEKLLKE